MYMYVYLLYLSTHVQVPMYLLMIFSSISDFWFLLFVDFDEDESADDKRRSGSSSPNPHAPIKRRKKQAHRTSSGGSMRVQELKAEARRTRKEKGDKEEGRRGKKKV